MLRREATEDGVPTITLGMCGARGSDRDPIDHALEGVRSVFAEYGLGRREIVRRPGWRTVIERTRLRTDAGGIVEVRRDRREPLWEGETVCRIANPLGSVATVVEAPFTGLPAGALENRSSTWTTRSVTS